MRIVGKSAFSAELHGYIIANEAAVTTRDGNFLVRKITNCGGLLCALSGEVAFYSYMKTR